jgi:hypothetical protein
MKTPIKTYRWASDNFANNPPQLDLLFSFFSKSPPQIALALGRVVCVLRFRLRRRRRPVNSRTHGPLTRWSLAAPWSLATSGVMSRHQLSFWAFHVNWAIFM